jgi:cytochrome b561
MALTNTPTSFGSVSRSLHWLTALLIFTAIGLSFLMDDHPKGSSAEIARATFFFSLHKTVGVTAFFVALARILWGLTQPRPGLLNPDRRLESLLAELVHWSLYGAMVIMPLSGWINHAATSGVPPIYWPFGQSLPLVPKSANLGHLAMQVHSLAHIVLYATIALHILGALKHSFVDHDATLARMVSGASVPVPEQRHSALPLALACAGWAFVFVVAYATARTSPPPQAASATGVLMQTAIERL